MERKTKFAFAAAVGAVSLLALNALAQPQQGHMPPGPPPAPQAPADQKPADQKPADSAAKPGDSAAQNPQAGGWARGDGAGQGGWRHRRGGGFGERSGMRGGQGMRNMSEADRKAFFEARLAAVKAGLQLNETQLRLWPPVETAVREMMTKRQEWSERIRKEGRPANPVDRMKRRGDFMAEHGAALQKFANAARPLYDTLTDEQKRRLRMLTPGMGRRGMMQGGRQGMGRQHRGMNRPGMNHQGMNRPGMNRPGMGRQGMYRGGDMRDQHRGMRGGMRGPGMTGPGNERWQRQGQFRQRWNQNDSGQQQGQRWQQGFGSGDEFADDGRRDNWQRM